jgi:hemolysin activation/secretion protein
MGIRTLDRVRGTLHGHRTPWILGLCCAAFSAAPAFGQSSLTRGKPTIEPTPAKVSPPEPQTPPAAAEPAVEEKVYRVARFRVSYGIRTDAIEQAFGSADLSKIRVVLDKRDNVYHAKPGAALGESVEFALGEFNNPDATFTASAIKSISTAIVKAFNDNDVFGVRAIPDPKQLEAGSDEKQRNASIELDYVVYVGTIGEIRTISGGARNSGVQDRVNLEKNKRLIDNSPVAIGDVIRKSKLDEYAIRASRHPGRRVDIAASPLTDKPGEVNLDYLVAEEKPWTLYAQVSNTGTESTKKWRERFGFIHGDITGHDDVLKIDYVTAGFSKSHAVSASYEYPLISDVLKIRGIVNWNRFTASDVGFAGREFTGQTWEGGAELDYLLYQHREWFLDGVGGLRYAGVTLDRNTEEMNTGASAFVEFQTGGVGTDASEAQLLGRTNPDTQWTVLKLSADHSFYLEPLLRSSAFRGVGLAEGQSWQSGMSLAHELAFSFRSQISLGDRVIPNAMQTAGGMYSVRGYPESIAAGDTNYIGNAEYRFHLPRSMAPSADQKGFRWVPPATYGRADWDLILKAFVDVGRTENSKIQRALEVNSTLASAGIGTELQFSAPFKASLRLDWGFALKSLRDVSGRTVVDKGDNRVHFSLTVLY